MTIRERYNRLLAQNRLLSKKLIDLDTKLSICQQKCLSVESAFDLSQKLVQHLKSDNQLLRSHISGDLFSSAVDSLLDSHLAADEMPITDITNLFDDSRPLVIDTEPDTRSDDSIDPNSGLSKSEVIIIEYEKQIEELREEWDLLSYLPIDYSVLITNEDQLKADGYLSEEPDSESDNRMEPQIDDTTQNQLNVSCDLKNRLKCKYCGKRFWESEELDKHKSRHKSSDEQLIRCAEDLCELEFSSKHDLKEHLKTVHRNKDKIETKLVSVKNKRKSSGKRPLVPKKTIEKTPIKRSFECTKCQKQLASRQSLRNHLNSLYHKSQSSKSDQTVDNSPQPVSDQQIDSTQQNPTIDMSQTPIESPLEYNSYADPELCPQVMPSEPFVYESEAYQSEVLQPVLYESEPFQTDVYHSEDYSTQVYPSESCQQEVYPFETILPDVYPLETSLSTPNDNNNTPKSRPKPKRKNNKSNGVSPGVEQTSKASTPKRAKTVQIPAEDMETRLQLLELFLQEQAI